MRALPVAVVVFVALVLLPGLDRIGFVDVREARDALVARELVAERELLTARIGEEALFDKPIAGYVPEVLARVVLGTTEQDSRELRAWLMLLLIIVTGSLGARHFGPRAGWMSAGVLATSLGTPLAARADGTQVLATLLGWLGAGAIADTLLVRPGSGRASFLLIGAAAIGTTLAAAGPLPALWPVAGGALFTVLARLPVRGRLGGFGLGLLLAIAMAMPWYAAMSDRFGAAFLTQAPFFPYALEPPGPWYGGLFRTVSFIVVGFFPWSALLPAALAHAATWWRQIRRPDVLPVQRRPDAFDPRAVDPISREGREENAAHFFVACLVASLVPVACYRSPPLTAVLPVLPAAALLSGRFLDHVFEDASRVAAPLTRAVGMLALFGTVSAVMLALLAPRMPLNAPDLRLVATVVFITSWAPFLANFAGRRRLAVLLIALPVGFGTPAVALRLLPSMESWINVRDVASAMTVASPADAPLVLLEPPAPSLRYYLPRRFVVADTLAPTLDAHRASDGLAYLAFRPRRETEVSHEAHGILEILIRTPSLVLARVHRD